MEDQELDRDIIANIALVILREPDGAGQLVSAAGNTANPAKGAAQFLMMMFDAISGMLEQTGLPFDFGVITSNGGVVDNLAEEVVQILSDAGIETGADFEKSMTGYFLEMVKSAAMAEQAGSAPAEAVPQAAGPANVGTTAAGMGGLLDSVRLGGSSP